MRSKLSLVCCKQKEKKKKEEKGKKIKSGDDSRKSRTKKKETRRFFELEARRLHRRSSAEQTGDRSLEVLQTMTMKLDKLDKRTTKRN